jgi:hypothetical protein
LNDRFGEIALHCREEAAAAWDQDDVHAADASDRIVRNSVIGTGRSERPQWRTFDFCSISLSATGVEVFKSMPKKTNAHQKLTSYSPNRRSRQVRRISALRDRFRSSWR